MYVSNTMLNHHIPSQSNEKDDTEDEDESEQPGDAEADVKACDVV